jgi:NAD(P)-dependent dehydrogenase (short-subunit alcohol dehydrogenase family)
VRTLGIIELQRSRERLEHTVRHAAGVAALQALLHAYQLAKRANSLRVMAEAVRWGKRGARINTISPGIIMTPLARDELTGPRGEGYRRMIELSPAGRAGTPDEVGTVGALLMGPDGAFITGSDSSWTAVSPPPTSSASSPALIDPS